LLAVADERRNAQNAGSSSLKGAHECMDLPSGGRGRAFEPEAAEPPETFEDA
jgi:hypothetical protein